MGPNSILAWATLVLCACSGTKETDTDTDTDTDSPPWELGACETPADLPADPLVMADQIDLTQDPLGASITHLVDIEQDPENGLIYGVGWKGLHILRDEGSLDLLSVYRRSNHVFFKVEPLGDDLVAISNRDYGWQLVNVSSPSAPQSLSTSPLFGASGMAMAGDRLLVVTHTGTVVPFDLSDSSAPVAGDAVEGLGNPWEILVSGDLAYVADNTKGIVVLDVSSPSAPTIVTEVAAAGAVQDIALGDGVLYAAVGAAGIETFDLATPASPVSLGTVDYGASIIAVSASGDHLWASNHEDVLALDISDPKAPLSLGGEYTDEWAMSVHAVGDQAYVANWGKVERYTVDASAPAPEADPNPSNLYFYDGSGTATAEVANRGSGDLHILGASIDDDRFSFEVSDLIVKSGQSTTITLTFEDDGEPVDTSLCLATNDPDEPIQSVLLASSNSESSIAIGEPAIDFTLQDLDGTYHQLSSQLGYPVVLAYFATW